MRSICMSIGLWSSGGECMGQIRDSRISKLHQSLNQISLCVAVLAIDDLEYPARSHEVVAGIRVGLVVRCSRIGVGIVVKKILLN